MLAADTPRFNPDRHARKMLNPTRRLSRTLKDAVIFAAGINLLLGMLVFFAPEFGLVIWPEKVPDLLARFAGSIVTANGAGLLGAVRHGTWDGIRALFVVGFVFGAMTLAALLYHLMLNAHPIFWLYAAVDAAYLVPIAWIYLDQHA
jgi:small basic protein